LTEFRGLVSVVIPALNEQFGIEKTISSIPKATIQDKLGYDVEVIVIDGDSADSTKDVARKMGARVIVEKQKGYGRAYKTGFAAAKGDIIVTMDADNTYPAEYIPEYIRQLNEKDLDFITINRFPGMTNGAMSLTRKFGNKILAFVMRILYSVNLRDSQSGMWLMKKSFISTIHLNADDMSMSEEIKIIAFKFFKSAELNGKYSVRTGTAKLDVIEHGWRNLNYLFLYKKLLKFAIKSSTTNKEKVYLETPNKNI